jgi:putative transposase
MTHRLNIGHPKTNSYLSKAMPNYRRPHIPGGTYFITQVTYQCQLWLCTELGLTALRHALRHVQQQQPI